MVLVSDALTPSDVLGGAQIQPEPRIACLPLLTTQEAVVLRATLTATRPEESRRLSSQTSAPARLSSNRIMLPYTDYRSQSQLSSGTTRDSAALQNSAAPILLFLPFFGSSQREWTHVIDRLCSRHRCISADMPGFGDAADVTGYSVTQMSAHLDELIRSFAPSPVILIAHSFSGKVGMVVAAAPPANLKQLILVAPSPLLPEPMTADDRATMTIANTTDDRIAAFVKGGSYTTLADDDFAIAVEDVRRANPAAWMAWPQSGSREDWSSRILEFKVATELIVGEHDKTIPLDFQRQHTLPLVARAGGKLTVIANAAHLLPYEAAAELVLALEDVLSHE